jgi:hypothetical protein
MAVGITHSHIDTPLTVPPPSFLRWAREQNLIGPRLHRSADDMFAASVNYLLHAAQAARSASSLDLFHDIHREGNKIIRKTPKREVDLSTGLQMLLYNLDLQHGIHVAPEVPLGSGRLDFLLIGTLVNGESAAICLEMKSAHSVDLVHGYVDQLPDYMRRKQTNYGIYGVLDFGPDFPPSDKALDQSRAPRRLPPGERLQSLSSVARHRRVRVVSFLLYPEPNPSSR